MKTLEELHEAYKELSPEERNERLQALYAGILESRNQKGNIEDLDVTLFKVLQKSLDTSIRYREMEEDVEKF